VANGRGCSYCAPNADSELPTQASGPEMQVSIISNSLRSAGSVADRILNALQQFWSIQCWSVWHIWSEVRRESRKGIRVWWMYIPAFLSIIQYMQSQGSFSQCDENGLGHLHPWTCSWSIQWTVSSGNMYSKPQSDKATIYSKMYGRTKNIGPNVNWKAADFWAGVNDVGLRQSKRTKSKVKLSL
jgi:hypothetical protein